MKKTLLNLSLIFLTPVAVVSCGYFFDITEIHPHFLDTKRGYSRKYEFYKVTPEKCGDPNFDVRGTGEKVPVGDMNGWVCFPVEETQYAYAKYLEYNRKQIKCPAETMSPTAQAITSEDRGAVENKNGSVQSSDGEEMK